ncbi:oxidoreductase, partial [Kouleothrix aurantiaca]
MSSQTLNIGVLGAGRIGRVHAANLATRISGARVLAVADPIEEAAQRCAHDFGIPAALTDYRAVLANPDIEAVLICTATDTHAQISEEAAQAGKQIFCEKPIALSLATIDRALAAVERAGVTLQIGFNRRFDANFRRVRQAIVQGEIGTPELLHIISRDPAPPPISYIKVSGGIFVDMTIHDFDMARFLVGSEVDEVYVAGAVMVDPAIGEAGDIDTALTVLRFANGAIGTIDNSRRAVYGYDQRVEVFGSGGAIAVSNNYPNNTTISDANSIRRDLPLNFFMDRYTESFVAELSEFVGAVTGGAPVP